MEEKMKKLLSLVLSIAMLLSTVVFTSAAENNTCVRLSDTSGSTGYSAGSDSVNAYVVENDGATLIFDVLVESYTTPTAGLFSQILAFSGASDANYAAYNFSKSAFTAGSGTVWPTQSQTSSFNCLSSRDYLLETDTWYELAFQFNGTQVIVYLDGTPMVAAELDSVDQSYLIVYPQFCTILIDNIRVCDKNYNVRDRVGTIVATEDFTGVTSVGGSSVWAFDTNGYTISQNGRPMPELGEMTPNRTVAPEISGAYLQYKESSGNGIAVSCTDFTAYNGFTVVEDIRVDRKSAGANFSVRFGSTYIAGYDWDNQCFRISQRGGYGFNTIASGTYAKVDYALELGTTYEFGVRQSGNIVSVYLNGVMVAQATNDAFATGFGDVQLNHYRMGASIDNIVIAYPDYDVKEAAGGTVAKLSFEESASYINSVVNFNIGNSGYGYSLMSSASDAKVSVESIEVADGATSASVGISLSDCPEYDAFTVSVAYPNDLSVSNVTVADIPGAVTATSALTKNPLLFSCVTNGTAITDTDVMDITFSIPTTAGDYKIEVTVTPYINDVEGAPITGTGTITVPVTEVPIVTGLPTGIEYDGEYMYWDYLDGASFYEIYTILPDDEFYEEFIIDTEDPECEFVFTDYFTDPGLYKVKIYAYNDDIEIFAVSDPYIVIYNEDESLAFGLAGYAEQLYNELSEFAASKKYSDDNQSMVDDLLAEAEDEMGYAVDDNDYNALLGVYDFYYEEISSIPEQEEIVVINGKPDGIAYSGTTLSWNTFSGTSEYKIYAVNAGGSESLIQTATTNSCTLIFKDYFTGAGEHQFKIYAYNASGSVIAVSNTCTAILDENGTVYLELSDYANALYAKLVDLVSTRLYSDENQTAVNNQLTSASAALAAAADYESANATYNEYYTALDAIPERERTYGEPDGITYDGTTMTWNEVDGAVMYEVYGVNRNGAETLLSSVYACEFEYAFADNCTVADAYMFKILAYNENDKVLAESDLYTVVLENDGSVYYGISAYAEVLYGKLEELVSGRQYTEENQEEVDAILYEASTVLAGYTDYNALVDKYSYYYSRLNLIEEDVYLKGDANNDGVISASDISYITRILAGAKVEVYPGCDANGDGAVTGLDLTVIQRMIG